MGERIYPVADEQLGVTATAVNHTRRHVGRYETAMSMVGVMGGRWLDIACGSGYGAEVIAAAQPDDYIGVDRSRRAIIYAQRHYHDPTRAFVLCDVMQFESERPFDAILSIETIEHLPDYFQQTFVRKLIRALRPSGQLVISFPVGDYPTPNPYHMHEPTIKDIEHYAGSYLQEIQTKEIEDGTYGPFLQGYALLCHH
jgi:SAM-dependent methyltransferase